jgi:hypothetical protein
MPRQCNESLLNPNTPKAVFRTTIEAAMLDFRGYIDTAGDGGILGIITWIAP